MSILSSIVGGIVNTIGGIVGGMANRSLDQQAISQQNLYNRRMRDEERLYDEKQLAEQRRYDRDVFMEDYSRTKADFLENRAYEYSKWQEQNKYNSPEEQMKRLKEAGLNPMLVYGHGVVQQAGAVPGGTAPQSYSGTRSSALKSDQVRSDRTRGNVDLSSVAEQYYRIRVMDEQLESIRATRQEVEEKTKLVGVQRKMAERDLDILNKTNKLPFPLRSNDPWEAQAVLRGITSLQSEMAKYAKPIKGTKGDRTVKDVSLPGMIKDGWLRLINYISGR